MMQDRKALFAALTRLDRLLDEAVKAAERAYGATASSDAYRGLYIPSEDVPRLLAREPGIPLLTGTGRADSVPVWPPLDRLAGVFHLDALDRDAIVIALAPEIDLRYERLYAYLQDDVTRRRPTVDMVLNLLCGDREEKLAGRARFSSESPLVSNQIIHLTVEPAVANPALLGHSIKLDEGVIHYLLEHAGLDHRVRGASRLLDPAGDDKLPDEEGLWRLETLARAARTDRTPLCLYFQGPRSSLMRRTGRAIAGRLGSPLIELDGAAFDGEQHGAVLLRECMLRDAVLYIDGNDAAIENSASPLRALWKRLGTFNGIAILAGQRPWLSPPIPVVTFPFSPLRAAERRRIWEDKLGETGSRLKPSTLERLAATYRLTEDDIEQVAARAGRDAQARGADVDSALFALARSQGGRDLTPMAQRMTPIYTWNDLVLPPATLQLLREIANQARHRARVLDDWGFDRKLSLGKGLTALFSGPPGVGKTMAVEVIATDLDLDVYRIDLSQVVSKYIGETEKNLSRVFNEAAEGNSILFFDECDALFGKRTDVHNAHDKYANTEVSYLLQRIEEYEGLCILATNFQQNLDPAFLRRIRFIVNIEFPNEESRRQIWEKVWPEDTPISRGIDAEFLARQFKLAGGPIRNAALSAAFLAAAEGSNEVRMKDVLRAVRREIEKSGRTMSRVELGRFAEEVGA
jgi:DNA polymerase III delta prime subunit